MKRHVYGRAVFFFHPVHSDPWKKHTPRHWHVICYYPIGYLVGF